MYGIRGLDAYLTAEPDDTVFCDECGYPIPDEQLAGYLDAVTGDLNIPERALCDGCAVDPQDDPHECPTDGQWR